MEVIRQQAKYLVGIWKWCLLFNRDNVIYSQLVFGHLLCYCGGWGYLFYIIFSAIEIQFNYLYDGNKDTHMIVHNFDG